MPELLARAALAAWRLGCRPAARRLRAALKDPRGAQAAALSRQLSRHAASAFGRAHGLSKVRGIEDFRRAVPARGYEDLRPWIERAMNGEPGVLTAEPVLMFEKTSGTSSAAKYIPYTASLKSEFQEAVSSWISDLYEGRPALRAGRAYWCVTPIARAPERSSGGLPVGFESDAEYLGGWQRRLSEAALAVPAAAARAPDLETGLYVTLRFLLQAPDLTFVSIWSPSFLEILLAALARHADRLLDDLAAGALRPPSPLPPDAAARLCARLRADPSRARALRAASIQGGAPSPSALWPRLALLSCWGDGPARARLSALRQALPGVELQPKGLLATEGVVTIPRLGLPGALPALTSHLLEFVEESSGACRLAHELQPGGRYGVLLTTGGGLWRYDLGDVVRVVGFVDQAPLLEFEGRRDETCDLVGEKLHAAFVARALEALRREAAWDGRFALLAPAEDGRGYLLFIEGACGPDPAGRLDRLLRENPHYAYARDLGQLRAVEAVAVRDGSRAYVRRCESLGQRAGGVKPAALDLRADWRIWLPAAAAEVAA